LVRSTCKEAWKVSIRERRIVGAAAVVISILLGGCGGSDDGAQTGNETAGGGLASATGEELIQAAEDEGSMVFYCSITPAVCEALGEAFEETYPGISIETLRITSSEQSTRYTSEKDASAKTADFLMNSELAFIESAIGDGYLTTYEETGWLPDDYPEEWIAPGIGSPYHHELLGVCYNTDHVTDAEAPQEFSDLLDPRWKGKITSSSPAVSPGMLVNYATIADFVGGDFLTKIAEQDIFFNTGGNVAANEQLAAGEYDLQMGCNTGGYQSLVEKGAPVGITYPPGVTGPPFMYVLNPEPISPNIQKLFAEWFVSDEGSQTFAELNDGAVNRASTPEIEVEQPNFAYFEEDARNAALEQLGLEDEA
jgi:iron(III) transport system substrate-binding protein